MERGAFSEIECFLWSGDGKAVSELVYYDHEGRSYHTRIPASAIESALRLFDGRPRAVRRRTGGLSPGWPSQLVVLEPASRTEPGDNGLRIRVRFADFVRDGEGRIVPGQYQRHSKLVHPSECAEPHGYHLSGPQAFVMDFGRGIVPVHVFHFEPAVRGSHLVHFIDSVDLERIASMATGGREPVTTYCADRAALRWAGTEAARARANAAGLRSVGLEVMPLLLAHTSVPVPTGISAYDVRNYLRLWRLRECAPLHIGVGHHEPVEEIFHG